MWQEKTKEIENIIKYEFINKFILEKAFINDDKDTIDLLSRLGKMSLEYNLLMTLYNEFIYVENEDLVSSIENDQYNQLLNKLIDEKVINNFIINNDLNKNLYKDDNKVSTNITLFYSIIGAILIDSSHDNNKVLESIISMLDIYNNIGLLYDDKDNYIIKIHDWSLKKCGIQSEYKIYLDPNEFDFKNTINKDENKDSILVELIIPSFDQVFYAYAKSITLAKMKVSYIAYQYLKDNNMLITYKDEVGLPSEERCINQLQELHDKGHIGEVTYKINQKYNSKAEVVWKARCMIEGDSKTFTFEDVSKKNAKRLAAYEMLKYVFSKEEK